MGIVQEIVYIILLYVEEIVNGIIDTLKIERKAGEPKNVE